MAYQKIRGETHKIIVYGMLMYGFTNEEIHEFTDIPFESVKTINQNYFEAIRIDYIKALYKRLDRNEFTLNKMQLAMFSEDEMDYGYSGKTKYSSENFKGEERHIFKKINTFGISKEFKL